MSDLTYRLRNPAYIVRGAGDAVPDYPKWKMEMEEAANEIERLVKCLLADQAELRRLQDING